MVGQFSQIFDVMWGGAQKASSRIKQLDEGIEPESTLVIQDMRRVYEIGQRMNDECKEEALMILASEMTVVRNAAMFEKLVQRQKDTGFTIRVLSPQITQKATSILPTAQWKKLEEPINVSILIYDRSRMFITQYSNLEAKTTEEAVSTNIYCTSKPTILGMISVFEALWRETELRQREERSRRQAELLQDVLTHDIRNYNQVSRIAVESIAERLAAQGESEYHQIASGALGAIDGSTQLVDKARKLGKILAEQGRIHLNNVDLIESIDRSFLLVKSAFPQKRIKATRRVIGEKVESPILVRADELLDEVFVNLFSNSAKFADGENVTIEVVIVEEGSFRSVLIKDSGPGIPPEQSETIFERYSKGRKGSGLGLSIVHALVVGRYGGQAKIINADNNGIEHISFVSTKGAIVSLLLQKGFAEESEKGFESKGGHLE